MPTFRDDQIAEMSDILATVEGRGDELKSRLILHRFNTDVAREFAAHGLARRIDAITYSISRVFEALPPDIDGVPTKEQRSEATAHLQAVAFNVYGCFDNLARVWVAERDIRRPNGRELGRGEIGLVQRCRVVRQSLPEELAQQLEEMDGWFSHLEDFRHATAHRVPLYIPPFMLDPANEDAYRELDRRAGEALGRHEFENYLALTQERDALRHFRPMIATSINEGANALFHPQLLADFATVELWVGLFLDNLREADPPGM